MAIVLFFVVVSLNTSLLGLPFLKNKIRILGWLARMTSSWTKLFGKAIWVVNGQFCFWPINSGE